MTPTPYPLAWPSRRPRTLDAQRRNGRFVTRQRSVHAQELTISEALDRPQNELDAIQARYPIVSTNMETRLDGRPRSGVKEPQDTGVAVYFQHKGKPVCLPCDTYTKVAQNIAAIAAHIEATRAIERHGVGTVAEMFSGFAALPGPKEAHWSNVLAVPTTATPEQIETAYRRLARECHPDTGGSTEAMAALNAARAQAIKEVG